jgi:hypothetical protein
MRKQISILGVLGLLSGLSSALGAESFAVSNDIRFNCTFEGPIGIGKGAVPLICTAIGRFQKPVVATPIDNFDDHVTVICGNSVVYSEGVIATFPTSNTAELRSIIPGAATITIRTLNTGVFTGPLASLLRIPGAPETVISGVCHLDNFEGVPIPHYEFE